LDHLISFEIALHQQNIRTDIDRLTELLHPEFVEIGYSGRTFDLKSTFISMSELPSDFILWSQSYEYIKYALDVVQVIYLSANIDKHGNLYRHAKRASIWVNESGNWQMKFHQATPVATFEKSNAQQVKTRRYSQVFT